MKAEPTNSTVPRPLFIEEHGLSLLLHQKGVGVELSRARYELGDWSSRIEEAWLKGKAAKMESRRLGDKAFVSVHETPCNMAKQLITIADGLCRK